MACVLEGSGDASTEFNSRECLTTCILHTGNREHCVSRVMGDGERPLPGYAQRIAASSCFAPSRASTRGSETTGASTPPINAAIRARRQWPSTR